MTAPNRNTLWARTLVSELAAGGVDTVCIAPGSRSTPLTVAFHDHPQIEILSFLDERSAGYFALGRGRRTGKPTPVVCTSGTAAANFHPAVMEANEGRVPLLVLTADRPPELQDSGANQTTDQTKLYGDAVRWYRTLAEPEAEPRKLRSLRVTAARAIAESTGTPPGPVHLNVPFRKPLEPTHVEGDVPASLPETAPLAVEGRDGPFVETSRGTGGPSREDVARLTAAFDAADRPLVVCGPANQPTPSREALSRFVERTNAPVLADPLSGHRFGPHVESGICGGYDSYLADPGLLPEPDLVVRFGASPTSKTLRKYLADVPARQFVVDPAGGWREAECTATDLVTAAPTPLVDALADQVDEGDRDYREQFERAERAYWNHVTGACRAEYFEGALLHAVAERAPRPGTIFVSNSMPVRDLDRFGRPQNAELTTLGNRGVSGIDGIVSSGLGAGSATDDHLVLVLGDLALYHDMNGLLAVDRCDVDATIVLVDNDGGGIFHKLPIEEFDPPFTEQFRTPHGLDFEPAAGLYDLAFERTQTLDGFTEAFDRAVESTGTTIVSAETDSESSHRYRERLHESALDAIRETLA